MTLPVIPERIGKYPIVRELGHGTTSRVFLGRDPFADREVAIKVMHKDPETDPLIRNRFDKAFLNEASLVGNNGDIKITDFGIALQHDVEMTQLEGVGSPMYMSPEQAQDQEVTNQADIYSLGVVIYRLLTGKAPFSASNSTSLLYQVINTVPPAPSVHRAGLPADLDRIVMRALAKNLDERYQTWEEFCADLAWTNRNLALQADSISDTEKFGAIKAIPFFREFAHLDVWEMVRIAAFRRLAPRETVVREGEACESFFLIAAGGARVTSAGRSRSVLGDGDCFGEIPYFEDRGKRTSSVVSITPLTIIEVNATALRQSSDACQKQFNRAFVRILLERVDRLSKVNAELAEAARNKS